jgi:hypothetical protein
MMEMRLRFLLVLVPLVAHADASTPGKPASAPQMIEYSKSLTDGKITRTPPNVLETPFRLSVGGRAVTVGFGSDFKIHVRAEGGGELVLEPAGQGFMSRTGGNVAAELVAGAAPVPLVKLSSRPEACSDYWEIYVSVVDGVPRNALELDGIADPPAMSTPSLKLAGLEAVVTQRTSEDYDGKKVRVTRTRYRFDGRTFVEVSKRATTHSK